MYTYKCTVKRIVDGDTVDLDIDLGFNVVIHNQRVRLDGIDTPECRTRDLEEKKYGFLAKAYVAAFLEEGQQAIVVTRKDDKGKYGRILGDFIVYDKYGECEARLIDIMIRDHIGVKYEGQNKKLIQEQHLANRELINESLISSYEEGTMKEYLT